MFVASRFRTRVWRPAVGLVLLLVSTSCRLATDTGESFSKIVVEGVVQTASGEPLMASVSVDIDFDRNPGHLFGPIPLGTTRSDGSFSGAIAYPMAPGTQVTLIVRARPDSDQYQSASAQARAVFESSFVRTDSVYVTLIAIPQMLNARD